MSVYTKVPDDDPLMVAWKAWQETGDYANAKQWAGHAVFNTEDNYLRVQHPHVEGSLWGAFTAGFRAAGGKVGT